MWRVSRWKGSQCPAQQLCYVSQCPRTTHLGTWYIHLNHWKSAVAWIMFFDDFTTVVADVIALVGIVVVDLPLMDLIYPFIFYIQVTFNKLRVP